MRSPAAVLLDVLGKDPLQMSSTEHGRPVQALGTHCLHPTLGVSVGLGRSDRGKDDSDVFGPKHLVERTGELGLSVADKEPGLVITVRELEREVPGLLGHPGRVGVGRQAAKVNPPRAELDEEQHVKGLEPDRLDREEVAGKDPLCL
jgi:hypothetical protein